MSSYEVNSCRLGKSALVGKANIQLNLRKKSSGMMEVLRKKLLEIHLAFLQ
jgi:hypothetical protein